MTETPPQQDERTRTGFHTENLRNYEPAAPQHHRPQDRGRVRRSRPTPRTSTPPSCACSSSCWSSSAAPACCSTAPPWLVVPEEGTEQSVVQTSPSTRNALLIVVGVVAALLLLGDSWGGFGFPWPLVLVAVVALVLLVNRDRPDEPGPPPSGRSTPRPTRPSSGWVGDDEPRRRRPGLGRRMTRAAPPAPPGGTGWTAPPAYQPPYQPPYQPSARPDRGPKLFGPTLALVAIALGSLGLYDTGHEVSAAAYAALALTVVGVMLLVGSVVGRAGGLIFLGIVATIALAISSAVDGNWSTERQIARTPVAASDIQDALPPHRRPDRPRPHRGQRPAEPRRSPHQPRRRGRRADRPCP